MEESNTSGMTSGGGGERIFTGAQSAGAINTLQNGAPIRALKTVHKDACPTPSENYANDDFLTS